MTESNNPPRDKPGQQAAVLVRRYVNDEIARQARRFAADGDPQQFLCECGNLNCPGVVELTLSEYEQSSPGSVVGHR